MGGGTSPLSSVYGLASDNVLEWEVVLADGTHTNASPDQNPDLYWALSGGGGGFAVVVSLTARVYPDEHIGGTNITFNDQNLTSDVFWKAMEFWLAFQPTIADAGGVAGYSIQPPRNFYVQFITFPNRKVDEIKQIMQPLANALDQIGISFSQDLFDAPTYQDHLDHYVGLPFGTICFGKNPTVSFTDNRLIPRSVVSDSDISLAQVLRDATEDDERFLFLGVTLNVTRQSSQANSVLPQWRDTLINLIVTGLWNYTEPLETNAQVQRDLIEKVMPPIIKATPGAGAYVNEANFAHPNWQEDYCGVNFGQLRTVKSKYDPKGLFYQVMGAGSEAWTINEQKALCKL